MRCLGDEPAADHRNNFSCLHPIDPNEKSNAPIQRKQDLRLRAKPLQILMFLRFFCYTLNIGQISCLAANAKYGVSIARRSYWCR